MEQAALLEAVVADIVVADVAERPARQQRVAMLAVARHRIAAVRSRVAFGGKEFGLTLCRPAEPGALETPRVGRVVQPHLLQKDEIGIERFDAQAEVVDLQTFAQTDTAHSLVDVVGGHAQARHVGAGWQLAVQGATDHADDKNLGSISTASALLGEKQRSAASRHGNQTCATCSRGLRRTGVPAGTVRPNTCSVLCVTPGA